MTANELRIGNWVYSPSHKANHKVIKLEFDAEVNTEPIPITEEWLFKFGFEKVDIVLTSIAIAPLNLPCTFNLPNTPFSFCQGKLILTTGTGDFCVNTEYVHQVQNLYFALTGEELTFKSE